MPQAAGRSKTRRRSYNFRYGPPLTRARIEAAAARDGFADSPTGWVAAVVDRAIAGDRAIRALPSDLRLQGGPKTHITFAMRAGTTRDGIERAARAEGKRIGYEVKASVWVATLIERAVRAALERSK